MYTQLGYLVNSMQAVVIIIRTKGNPQSRIPAREISLTDTHQNVIIFEIIFLCFLNVLNSLSEKLKGRKKELN